MVFANKMVPTEVAVQLIGGSYEDLVEKVADQVAESTLFDGKEARLVSTFRNFAIVGTEDGKFHRVHYKTKGKGALTQIVLGTTEEMDVEVIDSDKIDEYVQSELADVVEQYVDGNKKSAIEKLKSIARAVPMRNLAPANRLHRLEQELAEADWRSSEILVKSRVKPESTPVFASFAHLHNGTVHEDSIPSFRREVERALQKVFKLTEQTLQLARETFAEYKKRSCTLTTDEERTALLKFEVFAQGFLTEGRRHLRDAKTMANDLDVANKAVLHDALADSFSDLSKAAALITQSEQNAAN